MAGRPGTAEPSPEAPGPDGPLLSPAAAKALDMFLEDLVHGAVGVAEGRGARTLTTAHM